MDFIRVNYQFELVNKSVEDSLCFASVIKYLEVDNFEELRNILIKYGYQTDTCEIFDAKVNNSVISEEVYVSSKDNQVTLTCDDTKISYKYVKFIIKKFCQNQSVINIRDQGLYCEKCYTRIANRLNYPNLEKIREYLLDPGYKMSGLSVAKKIQFILKSSKLPMSSKEIYETGIPWEISGITPFNTIAARCSTLYQNKIIKKTSTKYHL